MTLLGALFVFGLVLTVGVIVAGLWLLAGPIARELEGEEGR